jgi:lysophospholipase L1-like esterase/mannose-6-phosphate isomerase-like protein (cupin superfamily)
MVPWYLSTAAGWGAEVNALRCALLIPLLGAMGPGRCADGDVVQRIFIVGDSTASYYGPERAPRTGWGQVLGEYFDASVEVRNHAQSGRSSRSFIEQGFFGPIMRDLGSGDLLLIQFGHNDEKIDDTTRYNEPIEAFPHWLMHYIDVAHERDATPVLITPVARRLFNEGRLVDTHGLYAESVRKLAAAQQVALFDLGARSMRLIAALGEDASKHFYLYDAAAGTADNTHFSRHGASAIACLVASDLIALRTGLAAHTRRDTACGAEAVTADTVAAGEAPPYPAIVAHQESLAITQPGPHGGAGTTTAYNYFRDAPALGLTFRKRVLHPGASIGPHQNYKDEIFYVISGEGLALVDGKEHRLRAGDALLSRTGGMHAIHQVGAADLELIIAYQPVLPPPTD